MTIETELLTLDATKTAIAAAIEGQGRDLTGKTFGEYAPEIVAIESTGSCVVPDVEAAWTDSAAVANGRLVADKQDPYDRVNIPQPGVSVSFSGTEYLSIPELTGSETVVSVVGTSTPTISAGKITFTAGTIASLELSNGSVYVAANILYDTSANGYHATPSATLTVIADAYGDQSANEIGYTLANYVEYEYRDLTNWFSNSCSIVGISGEWTQIALDGQNDPLIKLNGLEIGELFGKTVEISFEAYGDASVVATSNNFYVIMTNPNNQDTDYHTDYYTISTTPTVYKRTVVETTTVGYSVIQPRIDFNNNVTGNVYVRNYKVKVIDNDASPTLTSVIPASLTDSTLDAAGNALEFAGRNAHSLEIISGSDMSDYILQYVDDGPLDKYLAGSNIEDDLQNNYAGITATDKVIKFDTNGLAVFSTPPTVSSILQAIL